MFEKTVLVAARGEPSLATKDEFLDKIRDFLSKFEAELVSFLGKPAGPECYNYGFRVKAPSEEVFDSFGKGVAKSLGMGSYTLNDEEFSGFEWKGLS